jgi:hypothetical protein
VVSSYNLDTRRDSFSVSVDLNEGSDLVDIAAFDAPDDVRSVTNVSLIATEARTSVRDLGWRKGSVLTDEMPLEPGGQIVMAVTRTWLASRVAVLMAHGAPGTGAVVDIPFSTVLNLPRGPRASPRRLARIDVVASASRPVIRASAVPIDLEALAAVHTNLMASFDIDVPSDIIFEARKAFVLDVACAGVSPGDLALEIEDVAAPMASVRRGVAQSANTARFIIDLAPGEETEARVLTLQLKLKRETLLSIIDGLLSSIGGRAPRLLVTARMTGWGDGSVAPTPNTADRRWVLPVPALEIPVVSGSAAKVIAGVGDSTFNVDLESPEPSLRNGQPLIIEIDPDSLTEPVRYAGLKISILRWPLGRSGTVTINASSVIDGEIINETVTSVRPGIDRDAGTARQAQALMPLRTMIVRLTRLIQARHISPETGNIAVTITMAAGGVPFLTVRTPVTLSRCLHRMPVCIDLGASAISIWAGAPRPPEQTFDIKPLAIGSWLAANVDPDHQEATTLDGEAALLIPSHVSLDPLNHLRSDHAPQTLAGLDLIGSDREVSRLRMKHYGRRYDVSVPGPPPVAQMRMNGRRITGLKHALATGLLTLPVADPVNRYDAVADKVSTTSTLDVMPLIADVLDELMDLYVLRLGQDDIRADGIDPSPVVPRVIVTCPSGIGDEIQARYDAALGLFAKRLERLFPQAAGLTDVAEALPEAVAAARYVAELLAGELRASLEEPVILIALDLGASTSDVALARIKVQAGRVAHFETLATFGIPVGGDAIDQALAGIVRYHGDHFLAGQRLGWAVNFEAPDLARAATSAEPSCLTAEQWLASSVRNAKGRLTTAMQKRAEETGGPYAWSSDGDKAVTFDVLLAEYAPGKGWSGLFQPLGPVEAGQTFALASDTMISVNATDRGGMQLVLALGRNAVMQDSGPASQKLSQITHVLGTLLQRMARTAVPATVSRPRVMVVPTGRAALWPPLFEAIAVEAEKGRDGLPFRRPLAASVMKKAVVAGAALLSGSSRGERDRTTYRCPLGLAVMGVHLAEQTSGAFRTGAVAERILYLSFDMAGADRSFELDDADAPSLAARGDLGARFQFVRALPGLDPQGHMLAQLRPVLDHQDPMILMEGDAVVDARTERIDRFGRCEIISTTLSPDVRRVVIRAGDSSWEGAWQIESNRVVRIY